MCYNELVNTSSFLLMKGVMQMTPKDMGELISQVGFPVVVTLLLLYQQMKTSDSYYQLIEQVKTLVENNTKVLDEIMDKRNESK